jgi:hypothetical protein
MGTKVAAGILVLVVILVAIIHLISNFGSSNTPNFAQPVYTAPSFTATYNVSISNGTTYVKNASTGEILDSSADSVALINDWIQNNTVMYIESGNYERQIAINIIAKENFSLFGVGNSSYFSGSINSAAIYIRRSKNITVSGLGLAGDYNALKQSQTGVSMQNNEGCTVQYCTIQNFGYDGIHDLCASIDTVIKYNVVLYCHDDGINPGGGIIAPYTDGTVGCVVIHNYIAYIKNDALHISADSNQTIAYANTILNATNGIAFYGTVHNEVYENFVCNVTTGIKEHTTDCDYNLIHDCYFTAYTNSSVLLGVHSKQYQNTWE